METTPTQDRQGSFFRFEDLRIYAKANDYIKWLTLTIKEPRNEAERTLSSAFCHSAYDIALNIAEGSSRSKNQFEHYLKIAKTAIRECIIYTAAAYNVGMITNDESERSRELLMELTRMIGALIISLQRGSGRKRDDEDYRNDDFRDDVPADNQEDVDPLDAIDTNF